MDTIDEIKKEETIETSAPADPDASSLDDMLAAAVDNSGEPEAAAVPTEETTEAPAADETPVEAPSTDASADAEAMADEEAVADEEETVSDMVEDTASVDEVPSTENTETIQPIAPSATPAPKEYKGKWYIVHTYSGHENKVARTLMQRVQAMGFEERIYDALVPTRDTIRVRGGKKETIKEKIFPGYILVNMDLSDEAWVLVRTTPGVTSFVGAQNKPTPIRDDEVQAIVAFVGQKDPVYKAQFSTGEAVKITDGPFSDFLGTVESIDEAKGKIKVLVSIFGRETPVELDFLQVAKI